MYVHTYSTLERTYNERAPNRGPLKIPMNDGGGFIGEKQKNKEVLHPRSGAVEARVR